VISAIRAATRVVTCCGPSATVHDPGKVPEKSRARGWHGTGKARGIHLRAFVTEEKLQALWNESLQCLAVRRYPNQQAHVVSRKPSE
jgi:hypothetical protein